jgi:enediyne biosynthesis thioesterase
LSGKTATTNATTGVKYPRGIYMQRQFKNGDLIFLKKETVTFDRVSGSERGDDNTGSASCVVRQQPSLFYSINNDRPTESPKMNTTTLVRPAEKSINLENKLFPEGFPWLTEPKTFHHAIDVYLKDSNATGNVYFARYFEWQGICREKWCFDCIAADMLAPLGVFVTKEAQQKYVHETFAFQRVDCEVNSFDIKQCSFSLLFRFFVDGQLVSTGSQQIVFTDLRKKIARLPTHVIEKIQLYEATSEKLRSLR